MGTLLAPIGTIFVSGLFLLCAVCALSAAKFVKQVPMQRLAIMTISTLCIVRGLATIPIPIVFPDAATPFAKKRRRFMVLSGISCAVGYYLVQGSYRHIHSERIDNANRII